MFRGLCVYVCVCLSVCLSVGHNPPYRASRVLIACWTQGQKGPGSNRSRYAVG